MEINTNIKSKYLKAKVNSKSNLNLDEINDLIKLSLIEKYILNKPKSFEKITLFNYLKSEFNGNYLELLKELNFKTYKEEIENICPCPHCDNELAEIEMNKKDLIKWLEENK